MTEKFQNKYRIASARLQNWDYGQSAAYFITICTAHRAHFFGEIENGTMNLTEIGRIAKQEWIKSIEIRPDMNLSMGDFVVMPNHFHAIIFIGDNKYNMGGGGQRDAPAPTNPNAPTNHFGPQSKNLASIMRGFKSAVTTHARKNNIAFDWQSRYYDHIIRNGQEYNSIARYIQRNIAQWENDKFYKNNDDAV